jgi:GNAT superfamily N-acetyltransferase
MVPLYTADDLEVKVLDEREIGQIDRIFREAFSLQVGHAEPETFAPGRSCMARLLVEPRGAFGAYISGELAAVAFATVWGSVGVFGPVAVKPGRWNTGVGRTLLQQSIRFFEQSAVTDMVLCTFPDSVKHVSFYQRYGFHPGHLIAMLSKLVPDGPAAPASLSTPALLSSADLELYSTHSSSRRGEVLSECREVAESIYAGLDLSKEIEVAEKLSVGDTVLLRNESKLVAFAVCHHGPGSETEAGVLYVKFAAALPSGDIRGDSASDTIPSTIPDTNENFRSLLAKCTILAQRKNADMMYFGVNTARHEAYKIVLEEGFKIDSLSIAMQSPNRALYNRAGVYVIDDWR